MRTTPRSQTSALDRVNLGATIDGDFVVRAGPLRQLILEGIEWRVVAVQRGPFASARWEVRAEHLRAAVVVEDPRRYYHPGPAMRRLLALVGEPLAEAA